MVSVGDESIGAVLLLQYRKSSSVCSYPYSVLSVAHDVVDAVVWKRVWVGWVVGEVNDFLVFHHIQTISFCTYPHSFVAIVIEGVDAFCREWCWSRR